MGGFLRLNPECRVVMGAKHACLYSLLDGDMLSLQDAETEFLKATQSGRSVDEALADATPHDRPKLTAFLGQLQSRNIAMVYDRPYHIRPLQRGPGGGLAAFFEPLRLNALSLELTQECNLDCIFCGEPSEHSRGTGCGRYGDSSQAGLTPADRLRLLNQALELGVKELLLFGGEVLLTDEWAPLARAALEGGVAQVTLWTNGLLPLPEPWQGARQGLKLTTQVFSCVEEVHDTVAGRSGAFRALVGNLTAWRARGHDVQLVLVVTRLNQEHYRETQTFFQQFSQLPVAVRPLYPLASGRLAPEAAGDLLSVRRWFLRVNPRLIGVLDRCHSCYHGQLAVAADGRILPCIASRGWVLGNAASEELQQVLKEGRHEPYWNLAKAKLGKCSGCEFRLGCFDCRVIQGNGHSLTEVNHCEYDPVSGTWATPCLRPVTGVKEAIGR